MEVWDMIVAGGGPAGCTAALYAARAGLRVLLMEKLSPGGQMTLAERVENYPGFEDGIGGLELGERMEACAVRAGAQVRLEEVADVRRDAELYIVEHSGGALRARTVVAATGASPRPLGLDAEAKLTGRGVHYCAACDGMRYRGHTVAVIGGGNAAALDALTLSRICARVILIHRRDALRAEKAYRDQLAARPNVELRLERQPVALLGEARLEALRLRDSRTGAEEELGVDGAFVAIGRVPESGAFRNLLETDGEGYILAGSDTRTALPGAYAAGDVRAGALGQIVTAAADGAMAAHQAERYLSEK